MEAVCLVRLRTLRPVVVNLAQRLRPDLANSTVPTGQSRLSTEAEPHCALHAGTELDDRTVFFHNPKEEGVGGHTL